MTLLLGANAHLRRAALCDIEASHPGIASILVTHADIAAGFSGGDRIVWTDGAGRGAAAFLALSRRIAWSGPSVVYDLSPCAASRLLRFLVWPRPKWRIWCESGQNLPLS